MDGESEMFTSTSEIDLSTENKSSFCNPDSKRFTTEKSCDNHYEQNYFEEKFTCDKCNKSFGSKFHLEKHSEKHICKIIGQGSSCEISADHKLSQPMVYTGEKPFEYGVCKKSFLYNSKFQIHNRKLAAEKLTCHICRKSFLRKDILKQHLRIHTGEKPYTCEVCFKSFATKAQSDVHSRIHTDKKPYNCNICCKGFRHLNTFKYHNLRLHNEPERLQFHICDVCGNSFVDRSALLSHQLTHIKSFKPDPSEINNSPVNGTQDNAKDSDCSNDEQLRCPDDLKAQNDAHPEFKPYVCHICHQCFSDEKAFQDHSDTHTNSAVSTMPPSPNKISSCGNLLKDFLCHVEEKFICDVCDEQFNNSGDLNIHFKTHTEQKYYVCEKCQLCFIDEDDLRNHENIEECVYFHTCKICGEKFVDKMELETHCESHVSVTNEINFSTSFSKLSNIDQPCATPLKTEIEGNVSEKCLDFDDNRTEKVDSVMKDLPYHCELCNKYFTCEDSFKQHNVIHTEKKPHVCVLCLKSFSEKQELQTHVCKHDNKYDKSLLFNALKSKHVKIYVCNICFKSFTYYYGFQHHMFEHTQENECKTCDKRFFTADSLEAHRLQSHKPPMHPCIVCKEKFASKNDLLAHCFTHLGSGEYFICGTCKQCFKGREDLQKHSPCFVKT